jgi:maleate cis-trans isomerase
MSNPERPFGWRKRIGLLSPTVIETAAYDFYRLAPDGVSMCATTSNIEHWDSGQAEGRRKLQETVNGLLYTGFLP